MSIYSTFDNSINGDDQGYRITIYYSNVSEYSKIDDYIYNIDRMISAHIAYDGWENKRTCNVRIMWIGGELSEGGRIESANCAALQLMGYLARRKWVTLRLGSQLLSDLAVN